jgi:hypothetical protein
MQGTLRLTLLIFSIFLIFVITYILKKGRIPEKYAILWYFIAFIVLLVALFPGFLSFIAKHLGFQLMSNMIIGILIALLVFITMALTIIVSGQKKKLTLLIQEVSILKSEKRK